MILVTAFLFLPILIGNLQGFIRMKYSLLTSFLVFMLISLNVRADYYAAKTKDKEVHLWLDSYESEGYLYFKGEAEVYKLNRIISDSKKQTSYEFNMTKEKKAEVVGQLDLKKKAQDLQGSIKFTGQKKSDTLNFQIRKQSDVVQFETADMHIENSKCVFDTLDLRSVRNEKVVNRILSMNQKIVAYYSEYGCEYQTSKEATVESLAADKPESVEKAQLNCKSEIFLFKNRFYGINYFCRGSKGVAVKKKNFYQLYDTQLNIEIKKEDFTDSDINEEDDNLGIMFGLSPVGLFLYYADAGEKFETYQNHIPFFSLRKNFEKWGKPKRYLRYFELK